MEKEGWSLIKSKMPVRFPLQEICQSVSGSISFPAWRQFRWSWDDYAYAYRSSDYWWVSSNLTSCFGISR
jgi:hypothetical protein